MINVQLVLTQINKRWKHDSKHSFPPQWVFSGLAIYKTS